MRIESPDDATTVSRHKGGGFWSTEWGVFLVFTCYVKFFLSSFFAIPDLSIPSGGPSITWQKYRLHNNMYNNVGGLKDRVFVA